LVSATVISVFLLYGVACALHLIFLLSPRDPIGRAARLALLCALAAHTVEIGARCVAGIHPIASAAEALSLVGWLLAFGYAVAALRYPLTVVGAFVSPVCLSLLLLARLTPGGSPHPVGGLGALGRIHITLSTAGVALFALAAVVAVIYLVSEFQLKSKRFGLLFHRGPPLQMLDALGHRLVTVGFPVFTIAIVAGVVWGAQLSSALGFVRRPEFQVSMLAWLAFGGLLVARLTAGWQGRRAAWLTIAGFSGTLAVLGMYLLRYAAGG
jgi:ABC-type uncharacterized transport system permease subunit